MKKIILPIGLVLFLGFSVTFIAFLLNKPEWIQAKLMHEGLPILNGQVVFSSTVYPANQSGIIALPKNLVGSQVGASAPGYFIDQILVKPDHFYWNLRKIGKDNPDYEWVSSSQGKGNCLECHQGIVEQWQRGAHANGWKQSGFLRMYKSEHKEWSLWHDYPEGRTVCVACHAPQLGPEDPALEDATLLKESRFQGIECDFCHKVSGIKDRDPGLTHGRDMFVLQRPSQGNGQVFFGGLADAVRGDNAYAPVFHQSVFCASCHEGTIFGQKVYTTFSEWKASPSFAKGDSCQSCHMKPDGKTRNIAPGKGGIERHPDSLASHDLMPGGKLSMLRKCMTLSVSVAEVANHQKEIRIHLLARDVGHKVPTGHVDHHLLILLETSSRESRSTLIQGPLLPLWMDENLRGRTGVCLGRPNLNEEGNQLVPFWRAMQEPVDNRLEPEKPREYRWVVPNDTGEISVKLYYRAGWHQQSEKILVHERTIRP